MHQHEPNDWKKYVIVLFITSTIFISGLWLSNYFNNKKQSEKAYQYLKQAQSKDVELVKQKYLLFINEFNYGKYVNDELSVACYWTDRYDEGIKLIEEIIYDPKHNHDKKRLLDNLNFLKQKINK